MRLITFTTINVVEGLPPDLVTKSISSAKGHIACVLLELGANLFRPCNICVFFVASLMLAGSDGDRQLFIFVHA